MKPTSRYSSFLANWIKVLCNDSIYKLLLIASSHVIWVLLILSDLLQKIIIALLIYTSDFSGKENFRVKNFVNFRTFYFIEMILLKI